MSPTIIYLAVYFKCCQYVMLYTEMRGWEVNDKFEGLWRDRGNIPDCDVETEERDKFLLG